MNAFVKPPSGIVALWTAAPLIGPARADAVFCAERAPTVAEIIASLRDLPPLFGVRGAIKIGFADDPESFDLVPRDLWHVVRPRQVDGRETVVSLQWDLQNGGGWQTFATIAVLVVAALVTAGAATGLLPFLGASFTIGAASITAAQVAGGLIAVGGALAIAAFSAPPSLGALRGGEAALGGAGEAANAASSITGNQLQPGGALPIVPGGARVFPPLINQPLPEIVGDDVVVEGVYGLGGAHRQTDPRAAGVSLSTMAGEVQYETTDGLPGSPALSLVTRYSHTDQVGVELSTHDVSKADGLTLTNQGDPTASLPHWHTVGVSRDTPDEIWAWLDLPEGLFNAQTVTDYIDLPIRLRIRQRGTVNWIQFPELHFRNWKAVPMFKMLKFMFAATPPVVPAPPTDEAPIRAYKWVRPQSLAPIGLGGWFADDYFSVGGVSSRLTGSIANGIYAVSAGAIANFNDDDATTSVSWTVNTDLTAASAHNRRLAVIDLGANQSIGHVMVRGLSTSAAATGMQVNYSTDGVTWSLFDAAFNTGIATPTDYAPVQPVTARHIGLMASAQDWSAGYTFSGKDLLVYGGDDLLASATVATSKVANVLLYSDRVEFYLSGAKFPKGRYEIQVMRGNAFRGADFNQAFYTLSGAAYDLFGYYTNSTPFRSPYSSTQFRSRAVLKSLSSVVNQPVLAAGAPVALLAIKASRSRQLSQIDIFAERYTYDWDGTGWNTLTLSDNPAPHYREALSNPRLNKRPVPADLIGDDVLVAWRQRCIDQSYKVNGVIEGRSVEDFCDILASIGFARRREAEKFDVLQDYDRSAESPARSFSPRNMRRFRFEKAFPDRISGFRVRWRDKDSDYQERQIIVRDPYALTDDGIYEDIFYDGIDNEAHARRRALFDLKQLTLRMTFYSGELFGEAIGLRRGDFVGVQHDVLTRDAGASRIKSVTTLGGNVTAITLTGSVPASGEDFFSNAGGFFSNYGGFFAAARYGVSIRLLDSTWVTYEFTATPPDPKTLTFVTPFADPGAAVLGPDCLVITGPFASIKKRMLIHSIGSPSDKFVFPLVFVDEAPEIWT